jgi:hypothetical protein
MKSIDKSRFKKFLPREDAGLANSVGGLAEGDQSMPGEFVDREPSS